MNIGKIIHILLCVTAFFLAAGPVECMAQDTLAVKPAEAIVIDTLNNDSINSHLSTLTPKLPTDSLPWPQNLQARLDTIVAKAQMLQTSQMGLLVYDLTADSVLYAHDALQTLRPASTMKLITAITALDKLGPDYEYKTRLGYTGKITEYRDTIQADTIHNIPLSINHTGTLRGDIYIIGGMDPKISKEELRLLADTIKALGIDTIRGNLYADRSFKDSELLGEGWCWDDDNSMLSALVYKRKDNMTDAFLGMLKDADITFIGEIHDGVKPKGMKYIMAITHSLTDILKPMMKKSNNLYAESMLYQIGATRGLPSTAKKARAVEEALLSKIYKDPKLSAFNTQLIHRFADGSGLSLYNYLSADIEVAFLRYAYHHTEKIYKPLYEALPVAGVDGTLNDRMRGTCAKGNVHAKTGTLSGISSLAGYCTAENGHILAFAIINQNVLKVIYAKRLQDKICIAMTK